MQRWFLRNPGSSHLCFHYTVLTAFPSRGSVHFFLIKFTRIMQKQSHCEFCLWYSSQPNVKVAYGTKASCRWPNSSRAHLARGCLSLYLPTCQMTLSGEEPNKKNSLIFLLLRTQCFSHSSQPHLYSPNNHRFSALLKEKEKGGKKREREREKPTTNNSISVFF